MISELFFTNAELLQSHGIKFEHRRARHDLRLACPYCGGVLILNENNPWFLCLGPISCQSGSKSFSEILAALPTVRLEEIL